MPGHPGLRGRKGGPANGRRKAASRDGGRKLPAALPVPPQEPKRSAWHTRGLSPRNVSSAGHSPEDTDQPPCDDPPPREHLRPARLPISHPHSAGFIRALGGSQRLIRNRSAEASENSAVSRPVSLYCPGPLRPALVTARARHPCFGGKPLFFPILVHISSLLFFFFVSKNISEYKLWHGKSCVSSGSR